MYLDIGQRRRDGKFPITFLSGYVGSKSRPIAKVLTLEQAIEAVEKHGSAEQREQFAILKNVVKRAADKAAERSFLASMGGDL